MISKILPSLVSDSNMISWSLLLIFEKPSGFLFKSSFLNISFTMIVILQDCILKIILFYVFFSENQRKKITFQLQISVFVAKSIYLSCFCFIFISKICKLKSFIQECRFGDGGFTCGIQRFKDPSVFTQNIVDISHKLVLVCILFIKMRGTALVATKLFVLSAIKSIPTFQAGTLFHLQMLLL